MTNTDKLESYKIEIRSVLLPHQKGCYLREFNRAYFDLIGRTLPFKEMGFRTDIDFLYSMPDVVKITPVRGNGYHLMGVADDKSKHIQKMVARQKPAKLRGPPIRISLPPRFSRSRQFYDSSLRSQTYSKESEMPSATWSKNDPKLLGEVHKLSKEESTWSLADSKSPSKSTRMKEVVELVRHLKQVAVDDMLCEYKRMYHKNLSLSNDGFSTIEECLYEIPELEIYRKNNVTFVRPRLENQTILNYNEKDVNTLEIPAPDAPSSYKQDCDNGNVPSSLEAKLIKVSETIKNGIKASDFLQRFYEITGHTLDFVDLGYRCLIDLIDDVPDIFTRVPAPGSKKEFFIYPAKSFNLGRMGVDNNESSLKSIASNIQNLFVAYPEGIKLHELLTVYSINYKDSLHIEDFGFDNLKIFLEKLKSYVPIRFTSIGGIESILLDKISEKTDVSSLHVNPGVFDKGAIPNDAVLPTLKYKPHIFPSDFDFSIYVPAYVSSVVHAGHLYLQFQDNSKSWDEIMKLGKEIDNFYNGSKSELYNMKPIHMTVGAICIAKWPQDNHWYRAQIVSIPSEKSVTVFYVDFGTTDTIPQFLLRYTREAFIELPAQAVKCRLAFLKPPNNALKWNIQIRNRILELCEDRPLMAKIEETGPDGVYSVLICDTNGKEDVYINDVLIEEELAENSVEPEIIPAPVEPNVIQKAPEPVPCLNLLQALQAQYFLQAFAAVAPIFAQNEKYLGLLKEVRDLSPNSDSLFQSTNSLFMPGVGPPGFNTLLQSSYSSCNSDVLHSSYPSAASVIGTNPIRKSITNTTTTDFFSTSYESTKIALSSTSGALPEGDEYIENEEVIFDDEDDQLFQQFCQTVSKNFRRVKRVMLGDGYKIHIIVLDSQPYVSSGEISQLIWNNKELDYLITKLQLKDENIPVVMLSEDGHEQLFQQLVKFNVKGVQSTNGFKSSVVLYALTDVMKILNIFGHPSLTLRTRLSEEISAFNPNDRYWKESVEYSIDSELEDEDSLSSIVNSSATDDDKIERLCLYDLLAMKESIVCKRKKMLSSSDLCKSTDEIDKLEKLLQKVLNRIQEIREICQLFK